jgi:hypothetical protein
MSDEKNQRKSGILTWVLLVGTFLMILAGPSMVVLFFGLLPTFVAYIIDRSNGKSAAFTVGSANFLGVFPFIIILWGGENSFTQALNITTDLIDMLIMYSASAFGWLVFMVLPTIISSFVMIMQQRKVAQLRGQQKDLIEEWGSQVATLVELQRSSEQEHHLEKGYN